MEEKTESVQLYVEPSTKQALRIAAAKNEVSMAEYARDALIGELNKEQIRFND